MGLKLIPLSVRNSFLLFLFSLFFIGCSTSVDVSSEGADAVSGDQLKLENDPAGSGTVVSSLNLSVGETINVYAISRDSAGSYVSTVSAEWTLVGDVASVSVLESGEKAFITATAEGTGFVTAYFNGKSISLALNVSSP